MLGVHTNHTAGHIHVHQSATGLVLAVREAVLGRLDLEHHAIGHVVISERLTQEHPGVLLVGAGTLGHLPGAVAQLLLPRRQAVRGQVHRPGSLLFR